MIDCSCTLNSVLAWLCWIASAVMAALYAFVSEAFGMLGVMFVAAGATLHVRGFVNGLDHRVRAAFELGRESVRAVR